MPEYISDVEMGIDDETIVRSTTAEIELCHEQVKRLHGIRDDAIRRMCAVQPVAEVARAFQDLPARSGLSLSSIKIIRGRA